MTIDQELEAAIIMRDEDEAASMAVERYTPAKTLGGIPHLQDYLTVAEQISRTEMVPQSFRGKPDSILAAILYGAELGIGPMQSLSSINMIQGRPSLSAETMRALVLQSGNQIRVEATNESATAKCHRKEWDGWESVTFTLEDAKRAGLRGDNWAKYPRAMLSARVTSEACRLYFADIIAGLSYCPEEIESFAPAAVVAAPPPTTTRPSPLAAPEPEETGESLTEPQGKMILALFGERGVKDRDERLHVCSEITGREVASSLTLTKSEASQIIDRLQSAPVEDEPEETF